MIQSRTEKRRCSAGCEFSFRRDILLHVVFHLFIS